MWQHLLLLLSMGILCDVTSGKNPSVKDTCPKGWMSYAGGEKCVLDMDVERSWRAARDMCKSYGGDILNIHDAKFSDWLAGKLKRLYYWIALNDITTPGKLRLWDTNKEATYQSPNFKSYIYHDENCVFLKVAPAYKSVQMYDEDCRSIMGIDVVCEISEHQNTRTSPTTIETTPTPTMTPACPEGWRLLEGVGQCLRVFNRTNTWQAARDNCSSEGGDLVAIRDSFTLQFIKGFMGPHRYWIGLHDINHDGKFTWLNDQTVTNFTAWNNKPRNILGNEYCVELIGKKEGRWNDKPCHFKRRSICQKPAT